MSVIKIMPLEHQIKELMSSNDDSLRFKFEDNALIFSTDGYFLYVEDDEERGVDIFEKQDIENLRKYFNDFEVEFLEPMKKAELLLGFEIHVSDFGNMRDVSIRSLEIDFIKSGKKSGTSHEETKMTTEEISKMLSLTEKLQDEDLDLDSRKQIMVEVLKLNCLDDLADKLQKAIKIEPKEEIELGILEKEVESLKKNQKKESR